MKTLFRLSLVLGLALVLAFLSVGSVDATVVNFDDLIGGGAGSPLPVGYGGLSWDPNWFFWSWAQSPYTPSSPNTRIATHNYGGWIDFGGPVDFTGAYFSGFASAVSHFEGYLNNVSIGTSGSIAPSSTPTFLNANFGSAVDRVNVVVATYDHFAMDDLTYTEQPIPEPGTLLLLGTGLAGLAGYGKLKLRRRKKA